ncbi:hypothetical protein Tco_0454828 [Tanacetum coccineum]
MCGLAVSWYATGLTVGTVMLLGSQWRTTNGLGACSLIFRLELVPSCFDSLVILSLYHLIFELLGNHKSCIITLIIIEYYASCRYCVFGQHAHLL